MSAHVKCQTVLLYRYQMLPLRVRVNQGAMAMKKYSTLPKAPEQLLGGVLAEIQSVYSKALINSTGGQQ